MSSNVPIYMNAKSKLEKTKLIAKIIAQVRHESPSGTGMVRQNPKTLRWSYIGMEKAKDKIGHALRKAAQEYRRKQARHPVYHTPHTSTLQMSTSSNSLLDSNTTATRSMSSSDSDDDEDTNQRRTDNYEGHVQGSYCYPHIHPGSYSYPGHQNPGLLYPAPPVQATMYGPPFSEDSMQQCGVSYSVYTQSLVNAAYYNSYYGQQQVAHSHYHQTNDGDYNSHEHYSYDIPQHTETYKDQLANEDYPSLPFQQQGNALAMSVGDLSANQSTRHVPILPKQDPPYTPAGPHSWAQAIQEATLP